MSPRRTPSLRAAELQQACQSLDVIRAAPHTPPAVAPRTKPATRPRRRLMAVRGLHLPAWEGPSARFLGLRRPAQPAMRRGWAASRVRLPSPREPDACAWRPVSRIHEASRDGADGWCTWCTAGAGWLATSRSLVRSTGPALIQPAGDAGASRSVVDRSRHAERPLGWEGEGPLPPLVS